MNKGKYILNNGTFVPSEEYTIPVREANGVLFSEKIRAVRTALPFFSETLEMIKLKLVIFNQAFPEFTDHNGAGLKRQLERTLTKNKHFMDAVLTLTFRCAGQNVHYEVQSEKLAVSGYTLNDKGVHAAVFDKIRKPVSPLSNLSLGSEIYWEIANYHMQNSQVNQFRILNTEDMVVEAPGSNLYLIKGKVVRGAAACQGAYLDISKPAMLSVFKSLNLVYSEDEGITIADILGAEEILTVNAVDGIQWVVGFEEKRFFNHKARKINELFNRRG
jgi:hypothetical protein